VSVRFQFDGLEELKAELRNLPAALTAEASDIVERRANNAADDIRSIYRQHRVSGRLADGVIVTHFDRGRFSAGAIVKSTSPIAWLFDNGSQARHWASGKSTGTMWGKTPPTHVFVHTMIRTRRAMWGDLADLLERHGLAVSGIAA
jgi:hypothetical protein